MRGKKGKQKGNDFERSFCKKLSLFLSNGDRDDLFWRSSNSGGRHTVRKKKGVDTINQDGDVTTCSGGIGEIFLKLFSVECKHYKDIGLWSLIKETDSSQTIYQWWKKHCNLCSELGKIPILVVRQNNMPILWATGEDFYRSLRDFFNITYKLRVNFSNQIPDMYIYMESDIFSLDPELFCRMIEEKEKKVLK